MKPGYQTAPAYAKSIGKTSQYVGRLIKNGKIKKSSVQKVRTRWHIHTERANQDLQEGIQYTHHAASKPTALNHQVVLDLDKVGKLSFAEAQQAKENYTAALKKLEFETKRGELIPIADVDKAAFEMARQVRDALQNIPAKISAELASLTDIHAVTDLLNREIAEALEALADNG